MGSIGKYTRRSEPHFAAIRKTCFLDILGKMIVYNNRVAPEALAKLTTLFSVYSSPFRYCPLLIVFLQPCIILYHPKYPIPQLSCHSKRRDI